MPVHIFRRQLEYIKKHYQPLKLCDLVAARLRDGVYPSHAVVITVDDGYADFYRWAFPLLQEFEIPATVFVVTGLLDGAGWIWIDKVLYLCEHACGIPIFAEENQSALFRVIRLLPVTGRDSLINELIEESNVSIPAEVPEKYALMSWEQLQEVANSGLIEIGSHTRTHPILAYVNEKDSWEELYTSRCEIQQRLSVPVQSFCYPNAMPGDYRQDQVEMLRRAGYLCATVAQFGYISAQSNIFTLPRITGNTEDMDLFLMSLDGVKYFKQRILGYDFA
ncbi:polysaccharide deacetylase family protein [Thermodesulfobacteriota bacterium]